MVGQMITQINISDGGVPKQSIPRAQVSEAGLEGDRQDNLKYHGGPDRAVCLWSADVIAALQAEGHPIQPGFAGENVTISGLSWAELGPGTRLTLGASLELEITSYAPPCSQNKDWFADRQFNRISQQHHPGSSRLYARVLTPGAIAVGDKVVVSDVVGTVMTDA